MNKDHKQLLSHSFTPSCHFQAMLSYPYILSVYRAILAQSKAIQGRVYMAPFFATELNIANLGQAVNDSLTGAFKKAYPLSIVLPPITEGDNTSLAGAWDEYTVHQLFLKRGYSTSQGDIQELDMLTNTSQHTIVEDWHDMRRVAVAFLRILAGLTPDNALARNIRLSQRVKQRIVPVTGMGNDMLNGVLVTYQLNIFDNCVTADYEPGAAALISLPVGDQHPEHKL